MYGYGYGCVGIRAWVYEIGEYLRVVVPYLIMLMSEFFLLIHFCERKVSDLQGRY